MKTLSDRSNTSLALRAWNIRRKALLNIFRQGLIKLIGQLAGDARGIAEHVSLDRALLPAGVAGRVGGPGQLSVPEPHHASSPDRRR